MELSTFSIGGSLNVNHFIRYLGTSPGVWIRLQIDYGLMGAEPENSERIKRGAQPHAV